MKKLAMLAVVLLAFGLFAGDFYTKREFVSDINTHAAQKDTTWNTYVVGTSGYIWNPITRERATRYDVGDFSLAYPMYIHGVSVYLDDEDAGYDFSYKIYDKDGETVLWTSEIITSIAYDNDVYLDTPLAVTDDFWVSVVPNASGFPRVFSGVELGPDPASTHTYLKANDGTWNPMTDGTDHYEMFAYVLLSPYDGEDTLAPILRNVSGTEVFMGRDMELSINVHEQNSVVSPMLAQYDIGAGWVDFSMELQFKDAYTLIGTLPGQPGGTAGVVRFYLEDNIGNAEWSGEYPILWSRDLPVFKESFDGDVFPPEGWTLQTAGAGFTRGTIAEGGFVYEGAYSAVHWDDSGWQDDWLITPAMDIPSDGAYTVSFMQNAYWTYYYGLSEVCVSTDMVNWTQVYTPPYAADDEDLSLYYDGRWMSVRFSLGAFSGQTIYVGFHYQGDFSHQWYIDSFEVLYDYEGPQIVDITGNPALKPVIGAYLNNDMVITLNVSDRSGVKSVIGHYDIGGQTGDAVFSAAKDVEETWIGAIPAQSSATAGVINFTLVDIGDLVTDTTDYPIEFVVDTEVPIVKYLIENEAFIGSDMHLELAFWDESPIASCVGYYSKDFFETPAYEFALTPSKINEYVYNGTIPAETEEVFFNGRVYFKITDTAGNMLTTDLYTVRWLDGQLDVYEDFESGLGNWSVIGKWGIEEGTYISPTNALTESVNSNYGNNQNTYAMWANMMDWTEVKSASISFWVKYDIEAGFDYMYFDVSDDGGYNWINLKSWDGVGVDWNKVILPLDAVAGASQVTFRFRFRSDQGLDMNGMYIDDIILKSYNKDYGAPTIISDPYAPEFYLGVKGDYTDAVKIRDLTGVSEVRVYYTVEGGEEQFVNGTNTTGDWYEFTIPAQETGSTVRYRIWAEDTTEYKNSGYSPEYVYIAGEHMVYDAGIVSYYTTTDAGDAKAVRISLPDGVTETQIAYALIRNYQDLDHFSAPMKFHLWSDNGGVPGTDLIDPFVFYSECSDFNTSAMTRVDLRDKTIDLVLTGDFWIGFEATNDIVYTTMESPGEEGTTAYQRSFDGSSNGTGSWAWSIYASANYHMRAVLGEYSGIEGDAFVPETTTLEQNYPNPFNPATTINFNLAKDSKVSLVVYDVMGREVANLVNGNMVRGSHKVTFDASRLVSGVYYYTLKAGEMSQTKKMMLIK